MAKHDRRVKYQSKEEKPAMLSLRIPQALYDRLERYAAQHRQSVSELVRDGIEMRLEVEADPRSNRAGSTTEEELQIDGASILRDMQATLARHDTQIEALMQTRERQTTPAGNDLPDDVSYSVIHGPTALGLEEQERAAEQEPARAPKGKVDKEEVLVRIQQMRDEGLDSAQITRELQAEGVPTLSAEAQLQAVVEILEHRAEQGSSEGDTSIISVDGDMLVASMKAQSVSGQAPAGEDTRGSVPPYDRAKHHLGKLCHHKHAWGTSGKTLRNIDNQCLKCKAEAKAAKDARKKAEREAATT